MSAFRGRADIATARCALEFVDVSGGNNASKSISLRIAAIGEDDAVIRPSLKAVVGSPGWIRTSDHSINSRMLYR
jgi:hypothetical protein